MTKNCAANEYRQTWLHSSLSSTPRKGKDVKQTSDDLTANEYGQAWSHSSLSSASKKENDVEPSSDDFMGKWIPVIKIAFVSLIHLYAEEPHGINEQPARGKLNSANKDCVHLFHLLRSREKSLNQWATITWQMITINEDYIQLFHSLKVEQRRWTNQQTLYVSWILPKKILFIVLSASK